MPSDIDARIEELEAIMSASGKLIPEAYADRRAQHVGIASVREIVASRLRELLKECNDDSALWSEAEAERPR